MANFSQITHSLRETTSKKFPLGHLQELLSAALGYKTFASLQASKELDSFDEVEHIVCEQDLLKIRIEQLGYQAFAGDADLIKFMQESTSKSCKKFNINFYKSLLDFQDEIAESAIDEIASSHEYNDALSSTNAYTTYINLNAELSDNNYKREDGIEFLLNGTENLDQDQDKPYSGDKIIVSGKVFFERKGINSFGSHYFYDIGAAVNDHPDEDMEPDDLDPDDMEPDYESIAEDQEIDREIQEEEDSRLSPEELEKTLRIRKIMAENHRIELANKKEKFLQSAKESYAKLEKSSPETFRIFTKG